MVAIACFALRETCSELFDSVISELGKPSGSEPLACFSGGGPVLMVPPLLGYLKNSSIFLTEYVNNRLAKSQLRAKTQPANYRRLLISLQDSVACAVAHPV